MRFISNFQDFSLNEATLSLSELSKVGKTKPHRGDVLIDKIESDSPLVIDKTNKPIKIDKLKDIDGEWVDPDEAINNMTNSKGEYDEDNAKKYLSVGRRYKKVFKGEDDEEYQLNNFKKTADFGSSGAGSLTKDFESVQCIFMAIRQSANYALNSNNMISAFHNYEELVNDFGPLVFLPNGISVTQDMIEKFSSDRNWSHTFCRVPNMLWSSDRLIDVNINYSIYHVGYKGTDSPYIAILSKYKSFSKSGGFSDINIAKFCPADVYMISIENRDLIISDIESTKNLSELILTINKYFNDRTLVPISLKKVLHGTKCSIIVNNETDAPPVEFEFSHVEITNDPMTGISSKLVANSMWRKMKKARKMNFDSPDTTKKTNVDGEVEGSASRHGRISLNYINKFIDEKRKMYNSLPEINSYKELSLLSDRELKNKLATSYGEVERYSNSVDKSLTRGKKLDTINKKISKIQSLQIVHCILKLNRVNPKEVNILIGDLFKYALSIQTPNFMSPKYLRVI